MLTYPWKPIGAVCCEQKGRRVARDPSPDDLEESRDNGLSTRLWTGSTHRADQRQPPVIELRNSLSGALETGARGLHFLEVGAFRQQPESEILCLDACRRQASASRKARMGTCNLYRRKIPHTSGKNAMRELRALLSRLAAVIRRKRRERDMSDEMEANLQLHIESNARAGMSLVESRRKAIIQFGSIASAEDSYRDRAGLPVIENTFQDLRYAVRNIRRSPGFAVAAIITLALGIGSTSAMFSVVQAVLLRPLPYAEPNRLVEITETNPLKHWTNTVAAPANFADWQRMNKVFTGIAGYSKSDVFLSGSGDPQRLRGLRTTGNLFEILGVSPFLGRAFQNEETFEGKDRVAILSFDLWKTLFLSDRNILGRTITLSGVAYVVVGVMPSGFFFPDHEVRIFIPLGVKSNFFVKNRRPHMLNTIARLRPGITLALASHEMRRIALQLEHAYPETNTQMGVRLDGLHDTLTAKKRPALLMLFAAVCGLFLIVCSNVANLQLGRSAARPREISIRQALGASRPRLIRQLLTESLVLALLGGVFGLGIASMSRLALLHFAPTVIPSFAELRIDSSVILFNVLVTFCAPLLFGIVPAFTSSRRRSLGDRGEISYRGSGGIRSMLVVAEVAASVMLVSCAGLLIRSLIHLENVDAGFNPEHAITFSVVLPDARYPTEAQGLKALESFEDRLRALPGIQAVGATTTLALKGFGWTADATPEGRGRFPGDYERELRHDDVTPGYFQAIGAQLVRGRSFNQFDTAKSESVTIVNQALEKAYFHGSSAIGKRIKFGRPEDPVNSDAPWVTVVGVVADLKQDGLDQAAQPEAFTPFAQQPQSQATFVLRGMGDPDALIGGARRAIRMIDSQLVLTDVLSLNDVVHSSVGDQRFRTSLLSGFAGVALFLAMIGIYGVLAYSVTQRTKEIGIRLAVGASKRQLFGMVLGDGMGPVIAGSALGLVGAFATTRLLRAFLFGITFSDPLTYVLTIAAIVCVATMACAVPASKAIRVDPLVSLRDQ